MFSIYKKENERRRDVMRAAFRTDVVMDSDQDGQLVLRSASNFEQMQQNYERAAAMARLMIDRAMQRPSCFAKQGL